MDPKVTGLTASAVSNLAVLAEKVSRVYPMGASEVVGIRDIDLRIEQGELVVIKGESGSGKSTLLALLAGLDRPTGGRLTVAGLGLEQASTRQLTNFRRKAVGIVFQSFNLLPTLTVIENISLPALLAGDPHVRVRTRAMDLLNWLGLGKRSTHFPSQLSGGEMQRTAIARALINDPAIVLADEPTGNLDSRNGTAVIELLTEMNRGFGRTVIIATHGILADSYATASILLKDGSIVEHARK
jgi:putative ABC transport system ATP-binding protein